MGYFYFSDESDGEVSEDEFLDQGEEDSFALLNAYGAIVEFSHARNMFQNSTYAAFQEYVNEANPNTPYTKPEFVTENEHFEVKKNEENSFLEYRARDIWQMARIARSYGVLVDENFPRFVFENTRKGYILS